MKSGNSSTKNIVASIVLLLLIGGISFIFIKKEFLGNDDIGLDNELGTSTYYINKKDIDDTNISNTDNDNGNGNDKSEVDNNTSGDTSNNSSGTINGNENNNTSNNVNNGNKQNYYLIEGDFLSDNIVTSKEKAAMEHNTKTLQYLVDNASYNQNIKIPKGTYYFTKGGSSTRGSEDYVIRPKSGVIITGSGIYGDSTTIVKPYAEEGTIKYGLDMFYFNDLADSYGDNANYLEDVYFSDFIIDGEDVRGNQYNSSGKGFMINLCRNCTWDSVIVKNTDGTGFGMDNLINGKITNCVAINNGKNADTSSEGGSGFGIGTGYSADESVRIENCKSIGNTKFGYFFEHQGRFTKYYTASGSKGFKVVNSTASGNLYNFGGLRANDVSYINCTASADNTSSDGTPEGYTKFDIYFDDQSRRISVTNFKSEHFFDDIKKSDEYYAAITWAYDKAIVYGVGKNKFGVGDLAKRSEVITLLWRYAGRPGDVLVDSLLDSNNLKNTNIDTKFNDVNNSSWYVSAVKWGTDTGIINGTTSNTFSPDENITIAQFATMLWRYAGEPNSGKENTFANVSSDDFYYKAVNWAYNKGIISDKNIDINKYCTREEIVMIIYKYDKI